MKKVLAGIFFMVGILDGKAQDSPNEYGLHIISKAEQLQATILADSNKAFVKIADYVPGVVLDIKYATTQNVFYEKLYPAPAAFIRLPAAKALSKVQEELKQYGVGLKIYDAYRPYHVTCRMFEILPDTIYMGLPWKGSKHNRGIAADLTLVNLQTKTALKMPTPFDALVYAAHPEFDLLPDSVKHNRNLLIATMTKHGFKVDPVEWWHFNYVSATDFELLDIPHADIEKLVSKNKKKQ